MQKNPINKEITDKNTSHTEKPVPELKLNLTSTNYTTNHGTSPKAKEYNFTEPWTELKVRDKFIDKRSQHVSVIYNSKLYVYGGNDLNAGIFSDFYHIDISDDFNLSHWKPVICQGKAHPGPLCRTSAVLLGDKWYLFGGNVNATENTNKLWCFDFKRLSWQLVIAFSKALPPNLDSHSMCHYKEDGIDYLVIFGGFVGEIGECWNQVIKFEIAKSKWILPQHETEIKSRAFNSPCPRRNHSAVVYNNYMYIFGGSDGERMLNDLWRYDLKKNNWALIKHSHPPAPRSGHSVVAYKQDGFIIFGGIQDITHERNDACYFHFATEEWTPLDRDSNSSKVTKAVSQNIEEGGSPYNSPGQRKGDRKPTIKVKTKFQFNKQIKPPGSKLYSNTEVSPTNKSNSPYRDYSPDFSMAGNQSYMNNSISEKQRSPTRNTLAQASIEKKRKIFEKKKNLLLAQFEVSDPFLRAELICKSPTTESMKNSITALNYKRNPEGIPGESGYRSDSLTKKGRKYNTSTGFFNSYLTEGLSKYQIPVDGKLVGHKPCARDGHTATIFKNKMVIFGGDRHKMSFNDVYIFNLDLFLPHKKDDDY